MTPEDIVPWGVAGWPSMAPSWNSERRKGLRGLLPAL